MQDKCTNGKLIYKDKKPDRADFLKAGKCYNCLRKVHAPTNECGCAFLRNRERVCRDCAIAIDFVLYGYTKIRGASITSAEWNAVMNVSKCGNQFLRRSTKNSGKFDLDNLLPIR